MDSFIEQALLSGNLQVSMCSSDLISALEGLCTRVALAAVEKYKSLADGEKEDEEPVYFTREQAAKILHVNPRTIDSYIKRNVLKNCKKVGSRVLIPESSVDLIK